MARTQRNIWPTLILCASLLGLGGVAGFFLRPVIWPGANGVVAIDPAAPDDAGHGGSSIVEIMESTMTNMDLKFGRFEVRDYYQNIRIPARIVEKVPQSRRSVTAPISGRINKVFIVQGQAVRPGEKLFEFQINDESLSQSQVGLLGVISEINVNRQNLERLKPLAESGVVKRSRILDLELEIEKQVQKREALKQELVIRGMDEAKIDDLITNKKLMQTIAVFAPELRQATQSNTTETVSTGNIQPVSLAKQVVQESEDKLYYTVESISALEGSNQALGNGLCELTYHSDLLIEGMAYESDIERISMANDNGWMFTAHFGEGDAATIRDNLKLFKIDNHVDDQSQTYPIFVEIGNEIVSRTTDGQNRSYVNWRFKPGQRAHLEFPIEIWEKQVVVPLTSLAFEGLESFVFQKISHTHELADGTIMHEFKKVPVKVLHTDKYFAVIKKTIDVDVLEEYALDQAYKLNLALKQAAGGGADHGHAH